MEILEVVSQFIEVTVLRKTLSFLTNYLAFLAMESSLSPIDTIQHGSGNEATIDPPPVESNNEAALRNFPPASRLMIRTLRHPRSRKPQTQSVLLVETFLVDAFMGILLFQRVSHFWKQGSWKV